MRGRDFRPGPCLSEMRQPCTPNVTDPTGPTGRPCYCPRNRAGCPERRAECIVIPHPFGRIDIVSHQQGCHSPQGKGLRQMGDPRPHLRDHHIHHHTDCLSADCGISHFLSLLITHTPPSHESGQIKPLHSQDSDHHPFHRCRHLPHLRSACRLCFRHHQPRLARVQQSLRQGQERLRPRLRQSTARHEQRHAPIRLLTITQK